MTLLGAWVDDVLVGIGAMKRLSANSAELKSMRTHSDHLGRGVASAILEELIAIARADGLARLSLETGTNERFAPAVALYAKRGFIAGEAFAHYANGPHNQCYHLELGAGSLIVFALLRGTFPTDAGPEVAPTGSYSASMRSWSVNKVRRNIRVRRCSSVCKAIPSALILLPAACFSARRMFSMIVASSGVLK